MSLDSARKAVEKKKAGKLTQNNLNESSKTSYFDRYKAMATPVKSSQPVSGTKPQKSDDTNTDAIYKKILGNLERQNNQKKYTETVANKPSFIGAVGTSAKHALQSVGQGIQTLITDSINREIEKTKYDPTLNLAENVGLVKEGYNKKYGEIIEKQIDESTKGIGERYADLTEKQQEEKEKYSSLPKWQQVTAEMVGGSAQLIPQVAVSTLHPYLGTALLAGQVYGNSYAEAISQGATREEAVGYGLLSATTEAAIEKAFGGIPKLGQGVFSKKIASGVSKLIQNKTTQKTLKYIFDTVGEGAEEVASEFLSPYIKKATYDDSPAYPTIEDYLMAFGSGAVGSALFGAPGYVSGLDYGNKTPYSNVEYTNDTQRESQTEKKIKVIQTAYETGKTGAPKDGISFISAEQEAAYDEGQLEYAKGLIKALGENGIREYNNAYTTEIESGKNISQMEFLKSFNKYYTAGLTNMKKSDITGKGAKGYINNILQSSADAAYDAGVRDNSMRVKNSGNVNISEASGLIKNSAIDGIDSDTLNYIDELSRDLGTSVEIVDSVTTDSGYEANGSYENGTIKISSRILNNSKIDSSELRSAIANQIFNHEITHRVQDIAPKNYAAFKNLAYEYVNSRRTSNLSEAERYVLDAIRKGVDLDYASAIDEVAADFVASSEFAEYVAVKNKSLAQKILDIIKDILDKVGIHKYTDLERIARTWEKAVNEGKRNAGKASADVKTGDKGVRYSLSEGAEADIEKALNNINYTEDVHLTDNSPSIIASQNGVRDLPMLMKASHIRENVFSEEEARKKGLKINKNINYHGLGKELFQKIIDDLDNVTLAYRGTKNAENPRRRENYFLLISQQKDADGNVINVPVYINETGQYNRVFVDTNKIATAFGRKNFNDYINRELQKENLVKIKNRGIQASELTSPINASYNENISNSKLSQRDKNNNSKSKNVTQTQHTKFSTKSIDELVKENKKLERTLEFYKAQLKKNKFIIKDTGRLARRISKDYKGHMNIERELMKVTDKYAEYVNSLDKNGRGDESIYRYADNMISNIGYEIVRDSLVVNDENAKKMQEIKSILKRDKDGIALPDTVKEELRKKYGKYSDFRNRNLRWFKVSRAEDRGVPLQRAYSELRETYPDDFPVITDLLEQAEYLSDYFENYGIIYENPYSDTMEQAAQSIANEIRMSLLFEGSYKQSDVLKQAIQTEINNRKDAIKRLSQMHKDSVEWAKQKRRVNEEASRHRREESAARNNLLHLARRLNRMKTTPQNKAKIAELINDIDLVSVSLTGVSAKNLADLRNYYDSLKENPNFTRDIKIESILARLSKKHIEDMNIYDVDDLVKSLRNLENEIRAGDKLIGIRDRRNIYQMGEEVIRDINNAKGAERSGIGWVADWYATGTLSPMKEMRRITGFNDDNPLYKATIALQEGQTKMLDYEMRANQPFKDFLEDKKFISKICGEKANFEEYNVTVYDRQGKRIGNKTIEITPAMRMSLYLHNINPQNQRHMANGGVTIPDKKLYRKGNIAEAYNIGERVYLSPAEINKIISNMSEKEMQFVELVDKYFNEVSKNAINEVSVALKGYETAEVTGYFPINVNSDFTKSEFEALYKNETLESDGFLKARNTLANNPIYLRDINEVLEQYIRIHSRYIGLAIPVRNFNKLYNMQTSEYIVTDALNDYGQPLLDKKTKEQIKKQEIKEGFTESVKNAISKTWGNRAKNYIDNMMDDIQGVSRDKQGGVEFLQWINSRAARGVIGLHFSVAMNQLAGLPAAAYTLGYKPVIKAMSDIGKVDTKLIAKYTPLQWNRTKGSYDVTVEDMKKSGVEMPKLLDWPMQSDKLVTRKVWKMAEYYVRDNHKDLQIGTDAYYKKVAEMYNKAMYETQPNTSVMERPQFLRADSLTRSIMMFMGEPLKNVNIMYESVANWQAKKRQYDQAKGTAREALAEENLKTAQTSFVRGMTSQLIASIVYVLVTEPIKFWLGNRDKYKDEEGEYVWSKFITRPLHLIGTTFVGQGPFITELIDIFEAIHKYERLWDSETFVLGQIGDSIAGAVNIIDKSTKWGNGEISGQEYFFDAYDSLGKIAQMSGWSVPNVTKLGKAIIKSADTFFRDNKIIGAYYDLWLDEPIVKKTKGDDGEVVIKASGAVVDILYKAFKTGNKEAYDKILYDLVDRGAKVEDIRKSLNSKYNKYGNVSYDKTLGAYAGIKLQYDEEKYEAYVEGAEKLGIDKSQTEKAINIIFDEESSYKTMMRNIEKFMRNNNFDERQQEYFIKVAQKQYSIDDMTAEQHKKYSKKYDSLSKRVVSEIDFDSIKNNDTKNDLMSKAYKYAESIAMREASGGDYVISEEWITECENSKDTLGVSTGRFIELYCKYGKKVYGEDAINARNRGIDTIDYLTAKVEIDAIAEKYKGTGSKYTKVKRAEIENYLANRFGKDSKEYLFLLGTKYSSIKDDYDYIKYFGSEE